MTPILVHCINQYDEPDSERAKMQIGKWFSVSEKGRWCREHYVQMSWRIEPDGGSEPHWIVELYLTFSSLDLTYYYMRWPETNICCLLSSWE